jgi:hypothetical protein
MLLGDVRFLPTIDLQTQLKELESNYNAATDNEADIHTLSKIWQRIQQIKAELKTR